MNLYLFLEITSDKYNKIVLSNYSNMSKKELKAWMKLFSKYLKSSIANDQFYYENIVNEIVKEEKIPVYNENQELIDYIDFTGFSIVNFFTPMDNKGQRNTAHYKILLSEGDNSEEHNFKIVKIK